MTHSMTPAINSLILELHEGSIIVPFTSFLDWIFSRLATLIKFESAAWTNTSLEPSGISSIHYYLPHTTHHTPHTTNATTQRGSLDSFLQILTSHDNHVNSSNEFYTKSHQTTHLCHQSLWHMATETVISTVVPNTTSGLHDIIFFARTNSSTPFTETEQQLIKILAPHAISAWRRRQILHTRESAKSTNEASALVDCRGYLVAFESHFVHLLRNQWKNWNGRQLPESLHGLTVNTGQLTLSHTSWSAAPAGPLILLTGRLLGSRTRLSPRERSIAEQLATGCSYAKIAELNSISPNTVRNHISHIYKKLNVHNKVELARSLGLE